MESRRHRGGLTDRISELDPIVANMTVTPAFGAEVERNRLSIR
jgi:hypothetical protein